MERNGANYLLGKEWKKPDTHLSLTTRILRVEKVKRSPLQVTGSVSTQQLETHNLNMFIWEIYLRDSL